MKRITIERYDARPSSPFYDHEFAGTKPDGYAGCIEGETDSGQRWIMWLDETGTPSVLWPSREIDGAVLGQGVQLTAEAREAAERKRMAKTREIMACGTPEEAVARMLAACDAAERMYDGKEPDAAEAVQRLLARETPEQRAGKPQV